MLIIDLTVPVHKLSTPPNWLRVGWPLNYNPPEAFQSIRITDCKCLLIKGDTVNERVIGTSLWLRLRSRQKTTKEFCKIVSWMSGEFGLQSWLNLIDFKFSFRSGSQKAVLSSTTQHGMSRKRGRSGEQCVLNNS